MASRSAPAACTFTPGLRRPITEASLRPSLIGSQKLALNALNREGMIPTRVVGLPLRMKILLRMFGSPPNSDRSEEHTSELQSRGHLVCRLLLEKKKK